MIAIKSDPSQPDRPFLTDGGLETTLMFHHGLELPEFAAFPLLRDEPGRILLRDYYRTYLDIAADLQTGFILETPTWRANADWGRKIGYDAEELAAANRQSVDELIRLRNEYEGRVPEMPVSGCIGPRGDGYSPSKLMTAAEAETYHADQVRTFADGGADFVTALTVNYTEEAIGVVNATRAAGVPVVVSFTVETDGCLPTGETLREAIERTDEATDGGAGHFMINCAHPTHFEDAFDGGEWVRRIRGIRANASRLSHAELDERDTLDEGDPADLADRLRRARGVLPELNIFGGCCGTDHRHIRAIGRACAAA